MSEVTHAVIFGPAAKRSSGVRRPILSRFSRTMSMNLSMNDGFIDGKTKLGVESGHGGKIFLGGKMGVFTMGSLVDFLELSKRFQIKCL
jgi:hypothetical protein